MKQYYLGLAILIALTVGLTGFTLVSGKDSKRDEETSKKAETISNKLNEYIYQEGRLPLSLEEAGIKNVPSTIKYELLDEERFKFCAFYDKAYFSCNWLKALKVRLFYFNFSSIIGFKN